MEHTEVIRDLLLEWAHLDSNILRIEEVPDAGCTVFFDNDAEVSLEWRGLGGGFGLTASVGCPPLDRRFVVYEAVLCFNALSRDNRGCRIGLLGPDGDLVLELDASPQSPNRKELEALLTGFARIAGIWRTFVEDPAEKLQIPDRAFMFDIRA